MLAALMLDAGRVAAQRNASAATLKNPIPRTPKSIADGAEEYKRSCAACHGFDGKGLQVTEEAIKRGPDSSDLTDAEWDHGSTDGEIFSNIKNGIGPQMYMDGYAGRLTDEQIWNIVNYIRTLGTPKTAKP